MPDLATIRRLVTTWIIEGEKTTLFDAKMPLHPEFVYRLSGEWVGWNAFLGVQTGDPHYDENAERDRVETTAWLVYLSYQRNMDIDNATTLH